MSKQEIRWIKCESWKWWSTPLYYILLPFYVVRSAIWYIRSKDDEFHIWSNFLGLAQAECDIRTGRLLRLKQ